MFTPVSVYWNLPPETQLFMNSGSKRSPLSDSSENSSDAGECLCIAHVSSTATFVRRTYTAVPSSPTENLEPGGNWCPVPFLNLFGAIAPNGPGPLHSRGFRSHSTTNHGRQDSSRRVVSSSQRPVPDNTQHSQQTDIHVTGGIGTHNLSRRAAVDTRHRPSGYWDRLVSWVHILNLIAASDVGVLRLNILGGQLDVMS